MADESQTPDESPDTLDTSGDAVELPPQTQGETLAEYVQRVVQAAMATGVHTEDVETEAGTMPKVRVPKLDHAPESRDDAAELGKMFAEYRAEVAALRKELQAHRPRTVQVQGPQETVEQRRDARLALIAENTHYCPGCGKLGKYAQQCTGPVGSGHPPLEMVSTDELGGDPEKHTRAPSTDPDRPDLIAA